MLRIAAGHGQEIRAVAFSADDAMLAIGGGDGLLTLWDVAQPVGAPFDTHAGASKRWSSARPDRCWRLRDWTGA
jgi:hypothetical protein